MGIFRRQIDLKNQCLYNILFLRNTQMDQSYWLCFDNLWDEMEDSLFDLKQRPTGQKMDNQRENVLDHQNYDSSQVPCNIEDRDISEPLINHFIEEQSNQIAKQEAQEKKNEQNTPEIQKLFSKKETHLTKFQSEYSQFLFKSHQKQTQQKNLPRFLYRLIIKHFEENKSEFDEKDFDQIKEIYTEALERSRKSKKKVYLLKDLKKILGVEGNLSEEVCKKNRKIYSQILKKYSIKEMLEPKSQIQPKNRVKYLKTSKIYALRCRSRELITRIQSQ